MFSRTSCLWLSGTDYRRIPRLVFLFPLQPRHFPLMRRYIDSGAAVHTTPATTINRLPNHQDASRDSRIARETFITQFVHSMYIPRPSSLQQSHPPSDRTGNSALAWIRRADSASALRCFAGPPISSLPSYPLC